MWAMGISDSVNWDLARRAVVATVRDAAFFGPRFGDFLFRERGPLLIDVVAIETSTHFSFIALEDCAHWGVHPNDVFSAAWANTRQRLSLPIRAVLEAQYRDAVGPYAMFERESDETGLLESGAPFVPDVIDSYRGRVRGNPIFAIPQTGSVLITGDASDEAIERIAATALERYKNEARDYVSPGVYTLDAYGNAVPFIRPGMTHEGHAFFRATVYTNQREALRPLVDLDQILISKMYIVGAQKDGTCAAWLEQCESWLPIADYVTFQPRAEGEVFRVPWNRLPAGLLEPVPNVYPVRMRGRWPAPALLAWLKEHAVGLGAQD